MRKFCIAFLLLAVVFARGAEVKSGRERLRELVVFPTINLTSTYKMQGSRADLLEDHLVPGEIERLRKEVKEHPDDPERLLQLGTLLNRSEGTNDGRAYYERAEEAARKKSALRPQDGLALVFLGEALANLDKDVEAESVLRKATVVSPNEWRCRADLGKFLGIEAFYVLLPENARKAGYDSLDSMMPLIRNYQPPAELLAKSEKMRRESAECFDRAVSLAPREPDAFLGRANIQLMFGMSESLERYYRDHQPPDPAQTFQIFHPVASVRDFNEAARLCPDDYRVVGQAAWYEGSLKIFEIVKQHPNEQPSFNMLPEDTQASVHEAMSRLETMGQSADKEIASGALERLAFIKIMIMQDAPGAKTDLRRAVALEPAREKAWELLLGAAVSTSEPPEEMVSICESLVKCKNSAENHLLLAKALTKENKFTEAAAEIKKASDLEPDNVPSVLFAAALAIKGNGDGDLSLADELLVRAKDLIEKMPSGEDQKARERELLLDGAILSALADRPDDAKKWLDMVLEGFPDDQTAKDIKSAIQ